MAEKAETKDAEKCPGAEMIESWNAVVKLLVQLEVAWKKHRKTYYRHKGELRFLHPLQQRILKRVVHRQPFHFFLDDVSRDARTGVKKLFIKEKI